MLQADSPFTTASDSMISLRDPQQGEVTMPHSRRALRSRGWSSSMTVSPCAQGMLQGLLKTSPWSTKCILWVSVLGVGVSGAHKRHMSACGAAGDTVAAAWCCLVARSLSYIRVLQGAQRVGVLLPDSGCQTCQREGATGIEIS